MLSKAFPLIQTERKEIGISWTDYLPMVPGGFRGITKLFKSQTVQRDVLSLQSFPSSASAVQSHCGGWCDRLFFSCYLAGEEKIWTKAVFDWWTAEACLNIAVIFCDSGTQFPFFFQSLLLFQCALSHICDDEITLFLPFIVRTSSNQSCFSLIFLFILSCHLLASLLFFSLHSHI